VYDIDLEMRYVSVIVLVNLKVNKLD